MFFKNILAYSAASIFAQLAQLVQNLLVRGALAPESMGIWNRVGVIKSFAGTFDVGITQAAGRELPLLRGAGNGGEEQIVRSTACWAQLGQGILFAAGIVLFACFGAGGPDRTRLGPALIAAALVAVSSWSDAFTIFCQSAQCYVALGRSVVATALISVVCLPIAARFGGSSGMMGAAVAVAAIQAALVTWMAGSAGVCTTLVCQWPVIRRLVLFGLPLRLVDYPLTLFLMLDSLVVARFGSASQLALYATAQLLFAAASDIPGRMGNVLLSRIYILIGGSTDRKRVGDELRRYLFIQHTLLMPLMLTTVWWAAQFVLRVFLPKYASALEVAQILLIGVYFTPPNTLVRNFWIVDKRLLCLLVSNLGGLTAGAVALLAATRTGGFQLNWIAGGMVCGYAAYFAILLCSVGRVVWGARIAAAVGLGALLGSASVGCLLRWMPTADAVTGAEGLCFVVLEGWAKTQACLIPLYALGIWKGGVIAFVSGLLPKRQLAAAT